MSGGSKKVTVGYEYYLGVHLALPYGPVDSIDGIIVGERDAEIQPVSFDPNNPATPGSIYVDKPNLFGGKKREGGVRGYIDVLWGHETQDRNSYLATHQGANCPAYRGFTSLVFKSFLWSMMNPYFKAPWIKFKRLYQGWRGGSAWYPEKLAIMSPYGDLIKYAVDVATLNLSSAAYTYTTATAATGYEVGGFDPDDVIVIDWPDGLTYDAWSSWPNDSDNSGWTWRTMFLVKFPDNTSQWCYSLGDPDNPTADPYYFATEAAAGAAAHAQEPIYLTGHTSYRFSMIDINPAGNRGGLSLRIRKIQKKFLQFKDMNPAHIIYQCLTDVTWGMGYNFSDIDEASFTAVADKLYDENFGLSLMWEDQTEIEAFIKLILDHIDGSLSLDMTTGKFRLRLHRDDYVVDDLVELTTSNVLEEKSFQRAGYGEFANEVVVLYTDRMGNEVPLGVQNLASIQAQGAVISTTKSYPGIRESALASRVAMRDLRVLSTPLARVSLTTNRVLYNKEIGDVVAYTWPLRGIAKLPMRIVKIDKGNILNGKIEVELVEDVFSLPSQSYTSTTGSEWVDTSGSAQPVQAARAIEAPYWDVFQNMSRADLDYLTPDYAFGTVVAARGTTSAPINFSLQSSPDNITYAEVDTGEFCPTGTLTANIGKTDTSIQLSSFYELDQVELDDENGYMVVDDECMAVVSCDSNTGLLEVRRGVLDTVPADHTAGARVYFPSTGVGYDPTERTTGETTYYKPCPTTGVGTLDTSLATALPITFTNRASRPYPPGQLKVNGSYYPEWIDGPSALGLTWAHRDRLQQTVGLTDYTSGSIGPEAGTTYTFRIYGEANTLLRTASGISGTSYTYDNTTELADGGVATLDPYWGNVVYLLNFNGTHGSTTFTDLKGTTWTRSGDAIISTSRFKYGGASGYFDGNGDYISSPDSANTDFGTGDFTIEAWINIDAASAVADSVSGIRHAAICATDPASTGWCFMIIGDTTDSKKGIYLETKVSGVNNDFNFSISSSLLQYDTWYHIALSRVSGVAYAFVDGQLVKQAPYTANVQGGTVGLNVGRNTAVGYLRYFNGYIDDLRITKGVGRYTKNFTPPDQQLGQYSYASRLNGRLRFELESVRDGLTSWQHHDHTVYRTGYGWNYGMHYG